MSTLVEWSARWPFETRPRPPQTQCAPGGKRLSPASQHGSGKQISKTRPGRSRRSRETATTEGKSVSARLSPAEGEALEALKARHGFGSNSDALRALVRAASGMLEADPATVGGLEAIRAELHEIGVSVNAIALAAGQGRIDPSHEHWAALSALRQTLPEMRADLRAVVDEQRRRGIRLFMAWKEAEHGEPLG
ncbi:DNA mobilization endonuclease VirD1/MobC family subunit [Paracoccus sp. WLY502]|uniref:DNA mobilization endonuclease VirD1/MobC family subunit n=1 Tax=Paracoccus yibinensis TaxID=3068891 RepID=UPI002796AF9F|nr:DNA mobilization endonuclease VirD1/MobC family subunit [Paracoccus sp. WLY502]MDQ1902400.1 DNA mobilization endonuclease VirD1/MobC family subunit [Paracoccus sp. WLY502]